MSIFRRLPFVRKTVEHTRAITYQLSVLDERTAEIGPGVINTLVYDSASSLEALEHLVSSLRSQDISLDSLCAGMAAMQQWFVSAHEVAEQARAQGLAQLVGDISANTAEHLAAILAAQTEVHARALSALDAVPLSEFRRSSSVTQENLLSVLAAIAEKPIVEATSSENEVSHRLETLLLQILSRVDRLALEEQALLQRTIEQLRVGSEKTGTVEDLITSRLGEVMQSQGVIEELVSGIDKHVSTVGERVRQSIRHDVSEDVGAAVDLLAKEIGRLDDVLADAVKSRSDTSSSEWLRFELALRSEFSGEIQRSETRVIKDLTHARELISAELAARTGQIGTELVRSESSIRDEVSRRLADAVRDGSAHQRKQGERLTALHDDVAKLASLHGGIAELSDLGAATRSHLIDSVQQVQSRLDSVFPVLMASAGLDAQRIDSDAEIIKVLADLHNAAAPISGLVGGQERFRAEVLDAMKVVRETVEASLLAQKSAPATPTIETGVRSNPIDPEVCLAVAVAPFLLGDLAIDVGAHRGTWTEALSNQGLRILAVEPNPSLAAELRNRFDTTPRVEVVEAALGSADGTAVLQLAQDQSLGRVFGDMTLFGTTRTSVPSSGGLTFAAGPKVRMTTFAHLAQDSAASNSVAIAKINVQGTEHAVLDGFGLLRPEVVVSEFWGRRHLLNEPDAAEPEHMIERMIARGYRRWIGFVHLGDDLRARLNPRTFPDDCWGNLFFFAELEPFSIASRWCNQNLVGGCQ